MNFTPRPTYPRIRTLVGRQLVWTLRGTEESLVPDGTRTLASPVRSLSLYRLNNSRRLFPTCRWNALPRCAGPNPDRCLEDQNPGTGTPLPPPRAHTKVSTLHPLWCSVQVLHKIRSISSSTLGQGTVCPAFQQFPSGITSCRKDHVFRILSNSDVSNYPTAAGR